MLRVQVSDNISIRSTDSPIIFTLNDSPIRGSVPYVTTVSIYQLERLTVLLLYGLSTTAKNRHEFLNVVESISSVEPFSLDLSDSYDYPSVENLPPAPKFQSQYLQIVTLSYADRLTPITFLYKYEFSELYVYFSRLLTLPCRKALKESLQASMYHKITL